MFSNANLLLERCKNTHGTIQNRENGEVRTDLPFHFATYMCIGLVEIIVSIS